MGGTVRMSKLEAEKVVVSHLKDRDRDREIAALRTRLAQKFVSLADTVADAFEGFHVGAGDWVVELTAPGGMSTAGGKQSRQHFRLRPRRPGRPTLVGGSVDQITKTAELRDWDHLSIQHEIRFGKPVEISIEEWEQFLRQAEVVLATAKIASKRVAPPPDLREQRRKARSLSRVRLGALGALGALAILVGLVVWRFLAR